MNNKEDILRRAQSEYKDEREKQIEMNAFRAGWIGVTIVLLILLGFRWYFKEASSDLVTIMLAQSAASAFYQYKKMGDRIYLISFGLAIIGILLGFAGVLTQYGIF